MARRAGHDVLRRPLGITHECQPLVDTPLQEFVATSVSQMVDLAVAIEKTVRRHLDWRDCGMRCVRDLWMGRFATADGWLAAWNSSTAPVEPGSNQAETTVGRSPPVKK